MITDDLLRVSEDQDLNGVDNTTAVSADKIDLSLARDIGEGTPLYAAFSMTEAYNGTTLQFEVITTTDAALTTAVVVLAASEAIAAASLTLGARVVIGPFRPLIGSTGHRYLGVRYTTTGTPTTGWVTADIVETIQDGKKFHTSGFSVT